VSASAPPASSNLLTKIESNQRLCRIAFWLYALTLFTATHWPALKVDVPGIERPDLIVHCSVFALWFTLFWLTGYAGPIARVRTIFVSAFVATGYAAIDERLQAVPWVQRTCAWDDLEANWLGITIAASLAIVAITILNRASRDTLRV
jgi:hypothetical protein